MGPDKRRALPLNAANLRRFRAVGGGWRGAEGAGFARSRAECGGPAFHTMRVGDHRARVLPVQASPGGTRRREHGFPRPARGRMVHSASSGTESPVPGVSRGRMPLDPRAPRAPGGRSSGRICPSRGGTETTAGRAPASVYGVARWVGQRREVSPRASGKRSSRLTPGRAPFRLPPGRTGLPYCVPQCSRPGVRPIRR